MDMFLVFLSLADIFHLKKMGKRQIWECWSTLTYEIKYTERLFQNKYNCVLSAELKFQNKLIIHDFIILKA